MSWAFKIAIGVDIIGVLVALYFILEDYFKRYSGSTSLSLVTLGMCAWIGVCFLLLKNSMKTAATMMAWIPAVPLLCYAIMVLIMIIGKPDFK